jgi:hypothetical protein
MDRLDALERRTCKKSELHHKTKDDCEDKSKSGPGSGGSQPFAKDLDDNDDDVEREREQETVGDEDARGARRGEDDVLEVEGRQDGAEEEDKQKKNELEEREEDFFHG